ncbi:expressed protein [Phakopsora pachyrhizi]|uniref:Expressed protein n=1 Tax=Phakopsora pachyrhizi TaxID=170000 RepID=A0AAV0B6E9_PHAPC|nr:expressed protein [Phakopsora pachyrhizi]
MSTSTPSLKQGDRVSVPKGLVAFVGTTEFAAGTWVGLILDSPNGKNDGSVNGKRYFTCRSSCGMFVRPSQVSLLQSAKSARPSIGASRFQTPARSSTDTSITSVKAQGTAVKPNLPAMLTARSQQLSRTGSSANTNLPAQNSPSTTRRSLAPSRTSSTQFPTSPSVATSYKPSRQNSENITRSNSRPTKRTSYGGSDPISPSVSRRTSTTSAVSKHNNNAHPNLLQPYSTLSRASSSKSSVMTKNLSSMSRKSLTVDSTKLPSSLTGLMSPTQESQSISRNEVETPSLFEEGTPEELDAVDELEFEDSKLLGQGEAEGLKNTDHEMGVAYCSDENALSLNSPSKKVTASNDHFSLVATHKSPVINKTPSRAFNEGNINSPHSGVVPLRIHEELLTRYKLMEARRNEDRDKLRELEKAKDENEDWVNVMKPKLQEKLNDCLEEIKALKKQNKELEVSQQESESRLADFSDEVELATLDKEMAEERLDQAESLMVAMREELETLKVELSSLKEIQGNKSKKLVNLN